MALKNIWSKTAEWMRAHNPGRYGGEQAGVGDDGLISDEAKEAAEAKNAVVVKTVPQNDKAQSLEKLQGSFDTLVDKLQGINEHLGRQVSQHEELMSRIEKLPEILESFPAVVANQGKLTEQLFEQLKTSVLKEQQFVETIEKIPAETAKQTDALTDIDHQLAAAADIDVQMSERFKKFNETLGKLDESTVSQRESVMQMSKTFMTSDRYMKYLMTKQNKRFMWVFTISVGVCFTVILILAGIIIYLRQ